MSCQYCPECHKHFWSNKGICFNCKLKGLTIRNAHGETSADYNANRVPLPIFKGDIDNEDEWYPLTDRELLQLTN